MAMVRGLLIFFVIANAWAAPPPLSLDADFAAVSSASARRISSGPNDSAPKWEFEPLAVYAGDARVIRIDDVGITEVAPSTHRHFRLRSNDDAWRGVLTLDAGGAFVAATVFGDTAIFRGSRVATPQGSAIRFEDLAESLPAGLELVTSCGVRQAFSPAMLPSLAPLGGRATVNPGEPAGALVQARLAIDTDNELLNLKFANNTTAANNYVTQLVALMTVIYERDLGVRLTIGTTILRTAADPYATDGTSTPAQLNEFGEYWRVNQGAVQRAFALQLSGKSSSPNQASGIAWLLTSGNYCAATGQVSGPNTFGHFSISQVFRFGGSTAASDVSLVAHELGHNFGANHTHCTDTLPAAGLQPIDMCFNGEGGCYTGAVSCPVETGNQGTLMSYCNFTAPSGAGCGNVRQEFHPFHITQLSGRVLTNTQNGCFTAVSSGNVIFGNGFE